MARKSRKNIPTVVGSATVQTEVRRPFRAGLYARISMETEETLERGTIETQVELMKNFVADTEDISVAEVYKDSDYSGTNFDRPGFVQMMEDIKHGRRIVPMKQLFPRGKRIRPTDKDLVFHTALASLLPVFLLVVLLFHIRQIAGTDWQEVSLSQIVQDVNIPYLLFSMGVAGLVCLTAVLLFWRYRRDEVKQLIHRQKLARMVLENKWYESEQRKEDVFFKDLSSSRSKETITYFPKIYYRMKQGLLHIRVEITLGKYQEQLLNLEKKLESGLYCELTDKELKDSYVEYTLLYDTIANRISIEDVQAKDGRLRLMENVWWEYDKLPHMLIAGGTGGGKTYFILTLIEALLRTNAILFVLDPKNADLADLQAVMPDVYYKKEDMLACIDRFYEEMMKRSEDMKLMENYRTGENYAYLGLPAHFLIFDEYVAFMEMLGTKENAAVLNKLKQIVMLGRQAGFFLILACQRPDAKYLGDGIRDQFNFRVALGRMSEMGYGMMFGETTKDFFLKQIKGRGYVDVGTSVISEFYTPLVPKGHDFLKEIKKLIDSRQGVQAACGAKAAETD